MKLTIVPLQLVDEFWPQLAAGFNNACKRAKADDLNAGILWQMARKGEAFLILAHKGEEILQASLWRFDGPLEPESFRCIMLYGQNMKLWYEPMLKFISETARQNGAARLVTKGRRGWLRKCAGAIKINDDYEVDLNNGWSLRNYASDAATKNNDTCRHPV